MKQWQAKQWQAKVQLSDVLSEFDEKGFEQTRDTFVKRLLDVTKWQSDDEYVDLVDALRYSDGIDEFDSALDDLYDWADDDKRLWLET